MTLPDSYLYSNASTPVLLTSRPARGGTGGGTLLIITGRNFPLNTPIEVTIAGVKCNVTSVSSDEIRCRTDPYSRSSIKAEIRVLAVGKGLALNTAKLEFEYIDLWSSRFTWGGEEPPREGELAVIGSGQHIYFDAVTPVLKALIIQNGTLTFDDYQDVSLSAEYILLVDGGRLEIGTPDRPFQHRAVITMHGHRRSIELPIYGAKVLGVRSGTLDMHGVPVGVTWTKLSKLKQIFGVFFQS